MEITRQEMENFLNDMPKSNEQKVREWNIKNHAKAFKEVLNKIPVDDLCNFFDTEKTGQGFNPNKKTGEL